MTAGPILTCTYGRSKVTLCLPSIAYQVTYWFSRLVNSAKRVLCVASPQDWASNDCFFYCIRFPIRIIYILFCFIRYPKPVSPWLILVMLMTPTSWAWTLASLATVALCFNVASLVVRRWMGMRLENIEIDLWPFRWTSQIRLCIFHYQTTLQSIFSQHNKP